MKMKFSSLRVRMLLPVFLMILVVVVTLTSLFSRAYTKMVLQREQEKNASGFELVSRSFTPMINESIDAVMGTMAEESIVSYAGLRYSTAAELVHARISCRDCLQKFISGKDGIYGLLFMRPDGSLFGSLPDGNFFLDDPELNPLPEEVRSRILDARLGQVVWVGPMTGAAIYGFDSDRVPKNIMIAAWRSVNVNYGDLFALMLMDESIFENLFSTIEDDESTWHLFSADQSEIYHTGNDACPDPDRLISESNSGEIFYDENGRSFCAFSRTMTSPEWTLVREVSMDGYERVIRGVRRSVAVIAVAVFLIAMAIYRFWLKKFMGQFNTLLNGIVRMGEGELEPIASGPFTISEFETMHQEIDRTSLALNHQMDTIRRMEREQMEQENKIKEQERIVQELITAREIQRSALPHIFPPFPEREEIDLFASMDPAQDVGGDFYDYYLLDDDHLCLCIADVSGKGIPGALFMMISKRILEDFARTERNVSRTLEKTNEALCDNNQAEMFITVWIGILEISTGKLTAANAGHEYPAIRKKDGRFELYKDKHGFVIGGLENMRYKEYTLQLDPGDKLFVYTDGVPEAMNGSNEMFGTERMISALNTCAGESPKTILQKVKRTVDAFVGDSKQFDDLTMMCLEYRGPVAGNGGEPAQPMGSSSDDLTP